MRLFPDLTLAAFVAGIAAAHWLVDWTAPPLPLLLLALAAVVVAVVLRLLRWPAGPMLLAAALLMGCWRAEAAPESLPPVLPTGNDLTATLVVADAPQIIGSRIRFHGRVVAPGDGDMAGATPADSIPAGVGLLVYAFPPADLAAQRAAPYLRYGDRLRVSGNAELPAPIGDFDYAAWLESQGIAAILWARRTEWVGAGSWFTPAALLHRVRGALAQGIRAGIPDPQAGLAQALLLGIRGNLPDAVKDDFRTAGMSHLLAISGLHVGVVMTLTLAAAGAIAGRGSPPAVVVTLLTVWGYAILSGLEPPVARAAIMGSLVLGSALLGRGLRGPTALLLAAALMLAAQPELLGSLSFLLSFSAMAGVIVALPLITVVAALATAPLASFRGGPALWTQHIVSLLVASVIISLLTTLATMPLVAAHFGVIPLMSVPATILAMPALPFALLSAAITAVVGLIAAPLALAVGTLAWAPLAWLMAVAGAMPPHLLTAEWLAGPAAMVWYGALGLLIGLASTSSLRRRLAELRRNIGWRPAGAAAALAAAIPVVVIIIVLLTARISAAGADGRLHVHILDIGQGDAILVVTPDGRQLLIDGGPDPAVALTALGNLLPPTDRTLDIVAVTHLDSDHSGGLLGVLARYRAGIVLQGATSPDSALYPHWQAVLARREQPAVTLRAGQRIRLGDAVTLEVLSPPGDGGAMPPAGVRRNANNDSLAMRLDYGAISFLFTGDIESDVERRLAAQHGDRLQADVLKVAHHGSRTSTAPEFLRAVQPRAAVISAGRDNRFGHPHPEVTARLEEAVGAGNLFLTARDGTVEFISDGAGLWVKVGGVNRVNDAGVNGERGRAVGNGLAVWRAWFGK